MNPADGIHRFLEYVSTSLVKHPDAVSVRHEIEDGVSIYYMEAADEDDTRKILGKENRGLSAIRNLATAAAAQHGLEIEIELKGEGEPRRRRFIPPRRQDKR